MNVSDFNARYNQMRNQFIDEGYTLLNDDGEYLLGFKINLESEVVYLKNFTADNFYLDKAGDATTNMTICFDEFKRVAKTIA